MTEWLGYLQGAIREAIRPGIAEPWLAELEVQPLCGGDNPTQGSDSQQSKQFWAGFKQRENANKQELSPISA